MPPLHEYIKQKYGAHCGFDPVTNVFNMIEHQVLGNWSVEQGIQLKRSVIARETGLALHQVDKALKYLSDKKMLHIQKVFYENENGKKVWEESIYRLHPERYGIKILWLADGTEKPKFHFIPGGKLVSPSNVIPIVSPPPKEPPPSPKVPHEEKDPSLKTPHEERDPSHEPPHEKRDPSLKVPHDEREGNAGNPPPEPQPPKDKNLQEFSRISQEGKVRDLDKTSWAEVRGALVERHPGEEIKIDGIYRELQLRGKDDMGRPIGCLPALMLSSYESLKKARANPYAAARKEPDPAEAGQGDPRDGENYGKLAAETFAKFKNGLLPSFPQGL